MVGVKEVLRQQAREQAVFQRELLNKLGRQNQKIERMKMAMIYMEARETDNLCHYKDLERRKNQAWEEGQGVTWTLNFWTAQGR